MLRRVFLAAVVIVIIVVVRLFPDQNQALVDIDLLLTRIEGVQLWLALLATFAGGAFFALAFASLFLIKSSLVGRRYRRAISDLEAEVHHLRNLPLAGGESLTELGSTSNGSYSSDFDSKDLGAKDGLAPGPIAKGS